MRMSKDSKYPCPIWAHELSAALNSVFDCRMNTIKPEAEYAEDFNSPIAPFIFSPGMPPRSVAECLTYTLPLRDDLPGRNRIVLEFEAEQGVSTLAWRYDLDAEFAKNGADGVLLLLSKPSFHLEKLRYQAQIADQYEWCPMPAGRFWQCWPVGKLEQLRHLCRRRRLIPAEVLHLNIFHLYVILCRPSYKDALRRAIVFGHDDWFNPEAYADLSNLWGNLEATGQGAVFKSFAKVIRAQVKYLTEGKPE